MKKHYFINILWI